MIELQQMHQVMNILTTSALVGSFVALCVWGYVTEKEAK